MKIFKNLFSLIWKYFDAIMLISFSVSITVTMFHWNAIAGGVSLSVCFLLIGIASEFTDKKGGD